MKLTIDIDPFYDALRRSRRFLPTRKSQLPPPASLGVHLIALSDRLVVLAKSDDHLFFDAIDAKVKEMGTVSLSIRGVKRTVDDFRDHSDQLEIEVNSDLALFSGEEDSFESDSLMYKDEPSFKKPSIEDRSSESHFFESGGDFFKSLEPVIFCGDPEASVKPIYQVLSFEDLSGVFKRPQVCATRGPLFGTAPYPDPDQKFEGLDIEEMPTPLLDSLDHADRIFHYRRPLAVHYLENTVILEQTDAESFDAGEFLSLDTGKKLIAKCPAVDFPDVSKKLKSWMGPSWEFQVTSDELEGALDELSDSTSVQFHQEEESDLQVSSGQDQTTLEVTKSILPDTFWLNRSDLQEILDFVGTGEDLTFQHRNGVVSVKMGKRSNEPEDDLVTWYLSVVKK